MYHAQTNWSAEDVLLAAKEQGVELTMVQAETWWAQNEGWFRDALTSYGNEMLTSVSKESWGQAQEESREQGWIDDEQNILVKHRIGCVCRPCVRREDLAQIIFKAFSTETSHWWHSVHFSGCSRKGDSFAEHLLNGGWLTVIGKKNEGHMFLTLDKLLDGVGRFLSEADNLVIEHGYVNLGSGKFGIDDAAADEIIQCALFGAVIFRKEDD